MRGVIQLFTENPLIAVGRAAVLVLEFLWLGLNSELWNESGVLSSL
jgi:hypothetical protein